MITVLIRTEEDDGSRTVHGVVHLSYDPVRMDVVARYPKPGKMTELAEERVPLLSCVRNLKKRHGIPPREALRSLRSGEGRILQTDPAPRPAKARP